MPGGPRLLIVCFILSIALCALLVAEDGLSPSAPPKAKINPVEETVQGHKIVDPYRYLENPDDPATTLWVDQELDYTRSLLDPLPGREKINARLSQLLAIGSIGIPQVGGSVDPCPARLVHAIWKYCHIVSGVLTPVPAERRRRLGPVAKRPFGPTKCFVFKGQKPVW